MSAIEEMGAAIRGIAEGAGPSVVGLGNGWRGGSGVVLDAGLVLTNAHNLRGDGVSVVFGDGRTVEGSVAGVDVDGDIAMIRVETGGVKPLTWGEPDAVAQGTPVFALSNPRGRGLRVSLGFISGVARSFRGPRGRRIGGSLEHTAPLLPGSSGGPVVDSEGRLLGINTNRLGEGFYLAIPADPALRQRVEALGRGEAPVRPRLGIAVAPGHVARRMRRAVGLPEQDGLLVRGVEADGPAAAAGLQEGDLVVAVAGTPVGSVDDLQDALATTGLAELELTVLRGTEERTVTVKPAEDATD